MDKRVPLQNLSNILTNRSTVPDGPIVSRKRNHPTVKQSAQQNMMGDPATSIPVNKKTRQSQEDEQKLEDHNDDVSPMSQSSQESKSAIAGNFDAENKAPLSSRRRKKNTVAQILINSAEFSNSNSSDSQNFFIHFDPEKDEKFLESFIESSLKEREISYQPKQNYIQWQPFITPKMRTILLEWLYEVAEEYLLHRETMQMAINYIDRFLSKVPKVARDKFQLLGVTALFLASKLEEYEALHSETLAAVTDHTYTVEHIMQMEKVLVNYLEWKMLPPTPYLWLKLYMKRLAREQQQEFPKVDFACAMQFIDICMMDVSNAKFLPSQIAASTLTRFFCSDITTTKLTGYTMDQIRECLTWMEKYGALPTNPDPIQKTDFYEVQFRSLGAQVVIQNLPVYEKNEEAMDVSSFEKINT